jgi:branched-chain amino acid transport system ATP-binding protein
MSSVRALAEAGVGVLMAEPAAGPILRWVDRGYVMLRGHIRGERESADDVERMYEQELGLADAPLLADVQSLDTEVRSFDEQSSDDQ